MLVVVFASLLTTMIFDLKPRVQVLPELPERNGAGSITRPLSRQFGKMPSGIRALRAASRQALSVSKYAEVWERRNFAIEGHVLNQKKLSAVSASHGHCQCLLVPTTGSS